MRHYIKQKNQEGIKFVFIVTEQIETFKMLMIKCFLYFNLTQKLEQRYSNRDLNN